MKTILRRACALFLCVILCMSISPAAWAEETNRPYQRAVQSIDWSDIRSVGHQARGGQACACYALAYCRTILDERAHSWSEFNANRGSGEDSAYTTWGSGSYSGYFPSDKNAAFERIYSEVCSGKPVVVKVTGTRSSHHYVAVVGVENIPSSGNLSANHFLIIDPCAAQFVLENMGEVGYDLKYEENNYQVECDTTSATAALSEATPLAGSYLARCTVSTCDLTIEISDSQAYLKSLPCSRKTNKDSDDVIKGALPVGTKMHATARYLNDRNNYWYKVKIIEGIYKGKEGFVYAPQTKESEHVHDKGTYMYYWEAHPHYNCYRCSVCGEIWAAMDEPTFRSGCETCCPPSTAPSFTGAGRTIPDGVYLIVNTADPDFYLDVDGTGFVNGGQTNVSLWGPRAEVVPLYDTWMVSCSADGFYTIMQSGTDRALEVQDNSMVSGGNVQVGVYNGSDAQQWAIIQNKNGSYSLLSKSSGMCVNISGKVSETSNIQQLEPNFGVYQQWSFVPN